MRYPILTSGMASEYSVGPLASALRDRSWQVTELDFEHFGGDPWPLIDALAQRAVGYITSAHAHVSRRFCESVVPPIAAAYPHQLSPVEIIGGLRPRWSMYVPHDLLSPYHTVGNGEARFFDQFDFVLAPVAAKALQAALGSHVKVVDAGWIKYRTEHIGIEPARGSSEPNVVVFLSIFQHLLSTRGIDGICTYLQPLLGPNVRVKLPAWRGADEVAARLRAETSAVVVDANESSTELILGADVVVCNGCSSIHAEAALLGRPCIVLVDGIVYTEAQMQRELAHLPNLVFEPYDPDAGRSLDPEFLRELATKTREPILKPFDIDTVLELIEAAP